MDRSQLIRPPFSQPTIEIAPADFLKAGGHFLCELINPDGSVAWSQKIKNGVTNQGLNYLLNTSLVALTQITTWYLGLISGVPTLNASDTHDSHAGWTEFTSYSGSRATWSSPSSTAQSVANAASLSFSITGSGTLGGAFLASISTIGSTSGAGTLWATGAFSAAQAVVNGQTFKCSYVCTASAS